MYEDSKEPLIDVSLQQLGHSENQIFTSCILLFEYLAMPIEEKGNQQKKKRLKERITCASNKIDNHFIDFVLILTK